MLHENFSDCFSRTIWQVKSDRQFVSKIVYR